MATHSLRFTAHSAKELLGCGIYLKMIDRWLSSQIFLKISVLSFFYFLSQIWMLYFARPSCFISWNTLGSQQRYASLQGNPPSTCSPISLPILSARSALSSSFVVILIFYYYAYFSYLFHLADYQIQKERYDGYLIYLVHFCMTGIRQSLWHTVGI